MAYKNVVAMAYFVGIRIPDAAAAMLLTEAEGLAGFPLGLERIEGLLQTSSDDVGKLAGWRFTPKNSSPDHLVPVMRRATSDRPS